MKTNLKTNKFETLNNEFKQLPNAKKYEANKSHLIRLISNKRTINPDKNGNIIIYDDNGKKVVNNVNTIVDDVFNKNSVEEKAEITTPIVISNPDLIQSNKNQPPINAELKDKIKSLHCLKHQRIFLLLNIGVDKKEIMTLVGANAGEIFNVNKMYTNDSNKKDVALALLKK